MPQSCGTQSATSWPLGRFMPKASCRRSTPASARTRRSLAVHLWPTPVPHWTTCCASNSIARSGATTECRCLADRCKSRRSSIATTTSRQRCGCMSIPTGSSRCSTARAASLVMTGTEPCSMIRCHVLHKLVPPANPRLASCSPRSSTLRAAYGGGLWPYLILVANSGPLPIKPPFAERQTARCGCLLKECRCATQRL
jgi:hypothetical protein